MGKLIYSMITSLDGYIEDEHGRFDWAAPADEVHALVNDLEPPVGTVLYGRRMYETRVFWETAGTGADGVVYLLYRWEPEKTRRAPEATRRQLASGPRRARRSRTHT